MSYILATSLYECLTFGSCLKDQASLRNPGTSQLCESFSLERRVSAKRNTKDKRLWCIMLHKKFTHWYETIPSRHKEWNSMKNFALLAVFTIASIPSRIIQALSVLEFESVWIENTVLLISRRHSVKVLMSKGTTTMTAPVLEVDCDVTPTWYVAKTGEWSLVKMSSVQPSKR